MEPMKPMKPMKPLEPIRKDSDEAHTWWPKDLGKPGVTGSSNALRYAYFADKNRLAVDNGREVKVYDTGEEPISGFSSSDGKTLSFSTSEGRKKLSSLKLV